MLLLIVYVATYMWFCADGSIDFLFNSFPPNRVLLYGDAVLDQSTIKLTNDNSSSIGRLMYPEGMSLASPNNTNFPSFSTSFVFSILPAAGAPGSGLAFVISTVSAPAESLQGTNLGFLPNTSDGTSVGPPIIVEFDTGRNPEFNDTSGNHVGIDLNNPVSAVSNEAGFYNMSEFVPVNLSSGKNIQAWVEFDGTGLGINVTIAPVGVPKPSRALISFYSPVIAKYLSPSSIVVGFSASHSVGVEVERVLAWSFTEGGAARAINTSDLPIIRSPDSRPSSSGSISTGLLVGIVFISVVVMSVPLSCGVYWLMVMRKRSIRKREEDQEMESWEIEYWPHRYSYEELARATKGFSDDELLGRGGFGKVFKGIEANNSRTPFAVKSINRDSKQGFKEFMTEISTIGRLQHKNLVPLRGWCKEDQEMLLVYDYMTNGNLYSWIFSECRSLNWHRRLLVLTDIAQGLNYLHHGWLQVVLHRDIKSSNILLDSDMCARLGDFGLAKLYIHGQDASTTRLVGTIGYMAPELVKAGPTMASDIYSFGVVVLEVACGRKPTEFVSESEVALVDWVRGLHREGRMMSEAPDKRLGGEYEDEEMEKVLEMGLACCDVVPEMRPDMKEVVPFLMNLKSLYSDIVTSDLKSSTDPSNLQTIFSDYGPRT